MRTIFMFDQSLAMSVMANRALHALLSLLWHLRGSILLGTNQAEHELAKSLLDDYADAKKIPYQTLSFVVKSDRVQVLAMFRAFLAQHDGVGVHFVEIK